MKNWGIGCGIFIVIVIIAVIIGSCSGGGKPSGPLPKVDISASKDAQFEQAEKLKNDAFAIAKQFSLKFLKSPDSAKFQPQTGNSVTWWSGNTFLVTVEVDSQNSFGAMIRSDIMLEVEYVGDGNWKLLDAGSPSEVMGRVSSGTLAAAAAQTKSLTSVLEKGKSYSFDDEMPLYHAAYPENPIETMEKMKHLPARSPFVVKAKVEKRNGYWYEVSSEKSGLSGWISPDDVKSVSWKIVD
ncbi:MAG: hypothetical protein AB7F40_10205 [Victivallaceae bacterium]